jgi:hypothetical protein
VENGLLRGRFLDALKMFKVGGGKLFLLGADGLIRRLIGNFQFMSF